MERISQSQLQKILKNEQKSNKEINKLLDKEKEKLLSEVTLLLLGPGESGKSTISKQLRLINSNPWTEIERETYKHIIINNLMKSIRGVILAAQNFEYSLLEENQDIAEKILNCDTLAPDTAELITTLLNDESIQKTLTRSAEFLLKDSAPYYFEHVKRLAGPDYVPSDEDILRSRKKTTAIVETFFEVENTRCRVIDVGGQRSQRKKWIHLFQDVTAVIFCVSLSCYNQHLQEDVGVQRMTDSLELFDEIINNQWFKNTPVILFLNKVDLFKQKLKTTPIVNCFPDYKGNPQDTDEAIAFIRRKFFAKNKNPDKQIHTHVTCATDTNNIATVFNTVRKILLHQTINTPSTFL